MSRLNPTLALNSRGNQVKAVQNNFTKIGLTVPATETNQSVLGAGTVGVIKSFAAMQVLGPQSLDK